MKTFTQVFPHALRITKKILFEKFSEVKWIKLFFLLEFSYINPIVPLFFTCLFLLLICSTFVPAIHEQIINFFTVATFTDDEAGCICVKIMSVICVIRFVFAYIHCGLHEKVILSIADTAGLKNVSFSNNNKKTYFIWEIFVQIIGIALLSPFLLFPITDCVHHGWGLFYFATKIAPILIIYPILVFIIRMSGAASAAYLKGKSVPAAFSELFHKSSPMYMLVYSLIITLLKITLYIPAWLIAGGFGALYYNIQNGMNFYYLFAILPLIAIYIFTAVFIGTFMTSYSLSFASLSLESGESLGIDSEESEKLMEIKLQMPSETEDNK